MKITFNCNLALKINKQSLLPDSHKKNTFEFLFYLQLCRHLKAVLVYLQRVKFSEAEVDIEDFRDSKSI